MFGWVKIDEGLPRHPKVLSAAAQLGRDGVARVLSVLLQGLCYASEHLTDGFLPREAVDQFSDRRPRDVAKVLSSEQVGLWETTDGGYQCHDYTDYNPAAQTIKARRARDRLRKQFPRGIPPTIPRGILRESKKPTEHGTGRENTYQATESSTGDRRIPMSTEAQIAWFDRIYGAYPNKDRKVAANRAWLELGPDEPVATRILSNIEDRKRHGWVKFERRFIPLLATFLNDRMWEDVAEVGPVHDDDSVLPRAWQCRVCGEVHEGTAAQMSERVCLARPVTG